MSTSSEVAVTWAQALAWRMGRHLLDPVGSEPVAGVVRRLGAVLSMDESLAELAVRTRRKTSRPGELAKALADGTVIKAFALRPFRISLGVSVDRGLTPGHRLSAVSPI